SFKDEHGEPNDITNAYLPLEPGTTFVYEGVKDGEPVRDVVHVTNKLKQIKLSTGTVPAVVVHDVVKTGNPLKLEEDTFDYYGQDQQGNVWYYGEDATDYSVPASERKHGSWEAGVNGALPGIIMEAHPQVGDSYLQENA